VLARSGIIEPLQQKDEIDLILKEYSTAVDLWTTFTNIYFRGLPILITVYTAFFGVIFRFKLQEGYLMLPFLLLAMLTAENHFRTYSYWTSRYIATVEERLNHFTGTAHFLMLSKFSFGKLETHGRKSSRLTVSIPRVLPFYILGTAIGGFSLFEGSIYLWNNFGKLWAVVFLSLLFVVGLWVVVYFIKSNLFVYRDYQRIVKTRLKEMNAI